MNKILKRKQPYKPCWIRNMIFKCLQNEVDAYYNSINTNEYFIIYGYGTFHYKESGTVEIPVYYLEKADLTDENPYVQCKDWQKHPWDAPVDAVEWNSAS